MKLGQIGCRCDSCEHEIAVDTIDELRQWVNKKCPKCNQCVMLRPDEMSLAEMLWEEVQDNIKNTKPNEEVYRTYVRADKDVIEVECFPPVPQTRRDLN